MLCRLSKTISSQIWGEIRDSEKYGINIGEESITDHLLLKVARCRDLDIAVYKFSRKEESRQGADWQWLFLSPQGERSFGLRVQAKKIDVPSVSYKYLDHEIEDKAKKKHFQVDLLIEDANRNSNYRLVPIYFFFNYWTNRVISRVLSNRCEPPVRGPHGWTFALAEDIRPLAKNKNKHLDPYVLEVSYPIQCLFCNNPQMDLPERVRSNLMKVWPNKDIPPINSELPRYIRGMVESRNSVDDYQYLEYLRNIDGVVLIREKQ